MSRRAGSCVPAGAGALTPGPEVLCNDATPLDRMFFGAGSLSHFVSDIYKTVIGLAIGLFRSLYPDLDDKMFPVLTDYSPSTPRSMCAAGVDLGGINARFGRNLWRSLSCTGQNLIETEP